ncbi:MAG: asparagine synthase-related protein [Rhodospirillaceae bacterium]
MALAGCRHAGGPKPSAGIERALAALSVGRGQAKHWCEDGVGFGWTTDTAGFAVAGPAGRRCAAVIDGVIHNRSDLIRALGRDTATLDEAGLLVAGYLQWGEGVFDRLVGEFACALWDGAAQRLLLARDALGIRPLHVWDGGGRLLFASEPRGLLTDPAVPRDLDEEYLALWMSLLPDQGTGTFYRGIQRVPPGHVLVVNRGGPPRLHRYWRPEEQPILRLGSDAAYEEALRDALEEAVRCRLPASGAVGAHLSSGFDSSGTVVMAARLLAEQGRRLTAFTIVPAAGHVNPFPGRRIDDEGPFADLVAARHPNIDLVRVPSGGMTVMAAIDASHAATGGAMRSAAVMPALLTLGREAQRRTIKVMLSGERGNMAASYDGMSRLPSLLASGRLLTLAHEALCLRRSGWKWLRIAYRSIGPLLPTPLRLAMCRVIGRSEGNDSPISINPELMRRSGIAEQLAATGVDLYYGAGPDSRAMRLAVLMRNDGALIRAGFYRDFGFHQSAPTSDRRVVDLCFSIPDEQFFRDGVGRSLFRRAMSGLLPPEILNERRRGYAIGAWLTHFNAEREEFAQEMARLEASPLASRVLDLPRLRRLLDDWPSGPDADEQTLINLRYAFGRGLTAGRFVRSFENSNDPPVP